MKRNKNEVYNSLVGDRKKKNMLSNEEKKKIADELAKRQPVLKCPMCQHNSFIMADGYFNNSMQNDLSSFNIGGQSIPTIAIICSKCGFVSQHAIGILGLLPKQDNTEKDESNK